MTDATAAAATLSSSPGLGGTTGPILTRDREREGPRWRRGEVNPTTGKVFVRYGIRYPANEYWVQPERYPYVVGNIRGYRRSVRAANLDAERKADRESKRRLRQTPEGKRRTKASTQAFRKRHPERVRLWKRMSVARRRLRMLELTPPDANRAFIRQFYITAERVWRCTGLVFHVDHIRPVSRGGLHHQHNLQVLPAGINLRKGSDWKA